MKFSVVVTGQKLDARKQAVWLDDMFVEIRNGNPWERRNAEEKGAPRL